MPYFILVQLYDIFDLNGSQGIVCELAQLRKSNIMFNILNISVLFCEITRILNHSLAWTTHAAEIQKENQWHR
jgi:hypothetical protein